MKHAIASLLVMAALSGCGDSDDQKSPAGSLVAAPVAGTDCTICFRRDALGASKVDLWLDPLTERVNQQDITVKGKFVAADHDWIAIDTQPAQGQGAPLRVWLPRESVLAIMQRR